MTSQTVEKPVRIEVPPCAELAALAAELAGTMEPTTILSIDGCPHTRAHASRRCVVRWQEGPAIHLHMDGGQIAARPRWPDLLECPSDRWEPSQTERTPRAWTPSRKLCDVLSTVRVNASRPTRDLARDIVRRLAIPLIAAWPEAMKEHADATKYHDECVRAAEALGGLQKLARPIEAACGVWTSVSRSGPQITVEMRGLTPERAREILEWVAE